MKLYKLCGAMLIDTLKFCGVIMADHLSNIGLGDVQTHYDLRGRGFGALTLTANRG